MPITRANGTKETARQDEQTEKKDLFKISRIPGLKSAAGYNLWQQMMKSYLILNNLWELVDPTSEKNGTEEQNLIITSIILDKIKGTLFREVQYQRNPREIWIYIEKKMKQAKRETLEKLTDRLYKLNFDSVNELLKKYKILVTDYIAYGDKLRLVHKFNCWGIRYLTNSMPRNDWWIGISHLCQQMNKH